MFWVFPSEEFTLDDFCIFSGRLLATVPLKEPWTMFIDDTSRSIDDSYSIIFRDRRGGSYGGRSNLTHRLQHTLFPKSPIFLSSISFDLC